MVALDVVFQIPEAIDAGLRSGMLERIGGVIRETHSKQIVMWLRDSGTSLSPEQPLARILAQSSIMRAAAPLGASLSLVGLAVTVITFERTLSALSRLEMQVQQLEDTIREEFQRSRDLEFRAALERARDGFSGRDGDFRRTSVDHAMTALIKAREDYLAELETQLERSNQIEVIILSQVYLRALQAQTAYLKCLLLSNELELAKIRLSEVLPRLRRNACLIVKAWIGHEPALYFHKEVSRMNLERFFAIQCWIRDPDSESKVDENTVFMDILDEMRSGFWRLELIQPRYEDMIKRALNRPHSTLEQEILQYEKRLTESEMIVESYQRMLGFALELRTLRLSLSEWDALVDSRQIEAHGGAFIIDQEFLEHFNLNIP